VQRILRIGLRRHGIQSGQKSKIGLCNIR